MDICVHDMCLKLPKCLEFSNSLIKPRFDSKMTKPVFTANGFYADMGLNKM